jgi:hypothetical protein
LTRFRQSRFRWLSWTTPSFSEAHWMAKPDYRFPEKNSLDQITFWKTSEMQKSLRCYFNKIQFFNFSNSILKRTQFVTFLCNPNIWIMIYKIYSTLVHRLMEKWRFYFNHSMIFYNLNRLLKMSSTKTLLDG